VPLVRRGNNGVWVGKQMFPLNIKPFKVGGKGGDKMDVGEGKYRYSDVSRRTEKIGETHNLKMFKAGH